jgi:hypothetical protein
LLEPKSPWNFWRCSVITHRLGKYAVAKSKVSRTDLKRLKQEGISRIVLSKNDFDQLLADLLDGQTLTVRERRAFLRKHIHVINQLRIPKSALARAFFVSRQQIQKDFRHIRKKDRYLAQQTKGF